MSDSPVCADDTQPSPRRAGRVASGSGSADLRGRGRGRRGGGVFPETILDLLVTFQTRPDPRPDPDLGPQLHILFRDNAPSTRPHTGECYRAVLSAFISLYLDAWTDATHTARQYIARARSHQYRLTPMPGAAKHARRATLYALSDLSCMRSITHRQLFTSSFA